MTDRHRGIVRITAAGLVAALRLPEGTEVFDIAWERDRDQILLYLGGHPDLPRVPEGNTIPFIEMEMHLDGSARFLGWNA